VRGPGRGLRRRARQAESSLRSGRDAQVRSEDLSEPGGERRASSVGNERRRAEVTPEATERDFAPEVSRGRYEMPDGTHRRTRRAWQASRTASRTRRVSGLTSEREGDEPERGGGESHGGERVWPSVQRGGVRPTPHGRTPASGERGSGAQRNERDERATLRPTLRGGDPERGGGEPESSGGSDARRRWSRERTGTDSP